jgi:hypothetical protein
VGGKKACENGCLGGAVKWICEREK